MTTKSGENHKLKIDYPKGDYRDPMSEEELLDKFDSMVIDKVGKKKREQIVEYIMKLEKQKNIKDFIKLLIK